MAGSAGTTSGGSVLRGGMWHAVSRIVPQLYSLVISVVAARFLGPEGLGRQSFIAFAALSLTTLLASSLYVALVRYIGETLGRGRPELVRGLLAWALRIELVAALAGGAVLVAAGVGGSEPTNAWFLAAAVSAISILHTLPSAALIGLQRFREASLVGLSTGLLGTVATVVVLVAGGGITGMFAVEAVIALLNLAWTGLLARRHVTAIAPRPEPAGELRVRVARYAAVSTLGVLLTFVVARRSELFFLERFSTDAQIALYSIVFAVVTAMLHLPTALAASIVPAFASLYGEGAEARIRSGFGRAFRLLLILGFPLTAVGLAVGPSLLRVVYGEEYSGTGPVLLVMLAVYPLVPLAGLASALLTALGRLRLPLLASGAAAAIDIGLAALLIPKLDAVGAAIANVGGQVVLGVPLVVAAIRATGRLDPELGAMLRTAAAATTAGLAGLAGTALGEPFGPLLGLVVFALVFAVLARALRVLPSADARWLDDALGERLDGIVGRVLRSLAVAG